MTGGADTPFSAPVKVWTLVPAAAVLFAAVAVDPTLAVGVVAVAMVAVAVATSSDPLPAADVASAPPDPLEVAWIPKAVSSYPRTQTSASSG